MTQIDKDFLLKDLCARLPYGVLGAYSWKGGNPYLRELTGSLCAELISSWSSTEDSLFFPYLRPMSSMTEEELREFAMLKFKNDDIWEIDEFPEMKFGFKGFINIRCRNKNNGDTWIYQVNTRTPLKTYWGIDWLNSHHFDYRGLIEKGLALEAPEGMYKDE